MARRISYHVTHSKESNDWHVQKAGGTRSSGNYQTQADAVEAARKFAQNNSLGQVVIHRKDNNQIRTEYTYGKDPFPPAG